jgi:hypothetical protein
MAKKKQKSAWYHEPKWAALIAVLALAAAYAMASRSLHTGSWQQYFMTLGLLILGINRTAHLVIHYAHKAHRSLRKA